MTWMEQKGILRHWVLLELWTNNDYKSFMSRPLGNFPELILLNASLNKDIHESVSHHIIMSIANSDTPEKENPLAFLLETPKLGACAYTLTFYPNTGVAPLPHQIIDDISAVMHALHITKEHKGVLIPCLAIKTERRYL